jgi:uncharacterized protein
MRFTQDSSSSINVIRGYGIDGLRVKEATYQGALIISASTVISEPNIHSLDALLKIDAARILELQPELILLGTGARQSFPSPAFAAPFLRAGIGVEVMDTGAACRTYNVLVMEQRRVVALLLASDWDNVSRLSS